MHFALLAAALTILIYAPSIWVRLVMHRHSKELSTMPGTGGELARHLIEKYKLGNTLVERTSHGNDHFDPGCNAVRLSPDNYSGKSLTAVAVAAHEVGHAIQFHRQEEIFKLRAKHLPGALRFKKAGIILLGLLPAIAFIVKAPAIIFLWICMGVVLQLVGALSYLVVLPEEWDASFNKALPILTEGEYIHQQDLRAVRSVLKAAALTYFAAALADIVNIARWLLILRR